MIRSKIIPIILATFSGLGLQLQANVANAQALPGDFGVMLQPGKSLFPGFGLRTYTGYMLIVQQDGNVVLYNPTNAVVWSTNTFGNVPAYLTMQMDGNLVLYGYQPPQENLNPPVQQLWSSNTSNGAPLAVSVLYLSSTGGMAIFSGSDPRLDSPAGVTLYSPPLP
jgi:hypothetical protein